MWMIEDLTDRSAQHTNPHGSARSVHTLNGPLDLPDWEAIGRMVRKRTARVVALRTTAMCGFEAKKKDGTDIQGGHS